MSLRRRTYPEVLENLLTAITGGVAAESHPFPPPGSAGPPHSSPLEQPPATALVSAWGARDGRPHAFRNGVDFVLSDDGTAIVWPAEGAEYPDPGTLVQVSYRPEGARSALTDVNVGSVARTLLETTAYEMARLYAMLEAVYDAAFVDTATGSSLDNVVALLGIERVRGGLPTGEVELSRAPGSPGEITVPAGTRVATADGRVEYETTATATMSPAQAAIRVAVRDLDPNDPLPADSLTLLPKPIAGIAGARNPAPTSIAAQDETDAELRTRAKSFLHGSERATRGALEHAIRGEGITADIDESSARARRRSPRTPTSSRPISSSGCGARSTPCARPAWRRCWRDHERAVPRRSAAAADDRDRPARARPARGAARGPRADRRLLRAAARPLGRRA